MSNTRERSTPKSEVRAAIDDLICALDADLSRRKAALVEMPASARLSQLGRSGRSLETWYFAITGGAVIMFLWAVVMLADVDGPLVDFSSIDSLLTCLWRIAKAAMLAGVGAALLKAAHPVRDAKESVDWTERNLREISRSDVTATTAWRRTLRALRDSTHPYDEDEVVTKFAVFLRLPAFEIGELILGKAWIRYDAVDSIGYSFHVPLTYVTRIGKITELRKPNDVQEPQGTDDDELRSIANLMLQHLRDYGDSWDRVPKLDVQLIGGVRYVFDVLQPHEPGKDLAYLDPQAVIDAFARPG
jgi:hypothetical protein